MGHHTAWPKERVPVSIEAAGSVDELLNRHYISAQLKSANLKNIGVIIDANDSFQSRWQSIRQLFESEFPNMPTALPSSGLIHSDSEGRQLGIWIMPNNSANGMIETFLSTLIDQSAQSNSIWQHAISSATQAKTLGCNFKDAHRDKANIHTWLAWQDTPGDAFGTAILRKTLNPHSPNAVGFVAWFMRLFQLQPLETSSSSTG